MDQPHHFCAVNNHFCGRPSCEVWFCSAAFLSPSSTIGEFECSFNSERQAHLLILNTGLKNDVVGFFFPY